MLKKLFFAFMLIVVLPIVFVCFVFANFSTNHRIESKKEVSQNKQKEGINIDRIIDAYIYIENQLIWEEVRLLVKKYEDVKNTPIKDNQYVKIFKAMKSMDECISDEEEITFYFLVKNTDDNNFPYVIHLLKYSVDRDEFGSGGWINI